MMMMMTSKEQTKHMLVVKVKDNVGLR